MFSTSYKINVQDKYTQISVLEDKFTAKVAPDLKAELVHLKSSGTENIIFDLEKTNYCDSSGLSVILIANRICRENGGCLVLCNLQLAVAKLIDISQLSKVLNITPSFNEAVDFIFMDELEKGLGNGEEQLG
jgi:anti-sigma B factor antagonist